MCIFLQKENKNLVDALQRHHVMQNLQASKKYRAKQRLRRLLLSKRGLSAAFFAGVAGQLQNSGSSDHASSKLSKAARFDVTTWLRGG